MTTTYVKLYTNTFIVCGREYQITSRARFDNCTNQLLDDDLLDDIAVELANQKYREEFGVVSPDEIKNYRSKMKISQKDLADILGTQVSTIALYEAGAFPSRKDNRSLKTLLY